MLWYDADTQLHFEEDEEGGGGGGGGVMLTSTSRDLCQVLDLNIGH